MLCILSLFPGGLLSHDLDALWSKAGSSTDDQDDWRQFMEDLIKRGCFLLVVFFILFFLTIYHILIFALQICN